MIDGGNHGTRSRKQKVFDHLARPRIQRGNGIDAIGGIERQSKPQSLTQVRRERNSSLCSYFREFGIGR